MMRTLGWNKHHIIGITVMKVALLQVLPSLLIGLVLAFLFKEGLVLLLRS